VTRPAAGAEHDVGLAGPSLRPFALAGRIRASFTGRAGGVSGGRFGTLNLSADAGDEQRDVAANRSIVLEALGPRIAALAFMRQVHGADVVRVTDGAMARGQPPTADAIFTTLPAVALGVLVADCAPVLAGDPQAGLIGAAHAGRAGLAAGVVPALVEAMCLAGASVRRLRAVIGPAICGRCYEVPAELRAEVAGVVPAAGCLTSRGTPGIDIRAGVSAQLAALGVGEVGHDARCTAESAELYSYRRDGRTGRFAGLIWLAPGAVTSPS
jgi:purine-nucleoside/S-methyl-5'-thioadenosine phosphorylase / adenosine deaminase